MQQADQENALSIVKRCSHRIKSLEDVLPQLMQQGGRVVKGGAYKLINPTETNKYPCAKYGYAHWKDEAICNSHLSRRVNICALLEIDGANVVQMDLNVSILVAHAMNMVTALPSLSFWLIPLKKTVDGGPWLVKVTLILSDRTIYFFTMANSMPVEQMRE